VGSKGELRLQVDLVLSITLFLLSFPLDVCHFCCRSPILKRSAYNQIFHVSRLESPCLSTQCGVSSQKCFSCINHVCSRDSPTTYDFNGYRVMSKPSFQYPVRLIERPAIIAMQCCACKALENRCSSSLSLIATKVVSQSTRGTDDDQYASVECSPCNRFSNVVVFSQRISLATLIRIHDPHNVKRDMSFLSLLKKRASSRDTAWIEIKLNCSIEYVTIFRNKFLMI